MFFFFSLFWKPCLFLVDIFWRVDKLNVKLKWVWNTRIFLIKLGSWRLLLFSTSLLVLCIHKLFKKQIIENYLCFYFSFFFFSLVINLCSFFLYGIFFLLSFEIFLVFCYIYFLLMYINFFFCLNYNTTPFILRKCFCFLLNWFNIIREKSLFCVPYN